ncbi:MAG: Uncharacterized protein LiPW41_498 [Parcubacteria group bacterium LiPW_41]|nr:MAG: Uncharacterized protein LiPW41_498 [Parcubacteria group bacterium LiPW_41]
MAYPINIREKTITMRKQGFSLNEIHTKTGVAKGTLSVWLRDVELSDGARSKLLGKIKKGQYISAENKKEKTKKIFQKYLEEGRKEIDDVDIDKGLARIICSLIYWCEGAKSEKTGIAFTNSDPQLVRTFLAMLRSGFDVDERKFSVCVHLHSYHNPGKQLEFWSKTANIPLERFIKPYQKKNTGKRIKENYQGCITIKYYNNDLARRVLMLGKATISKLGA